MIPRLKIFINKHPILTIMRIIIFAIVVALIVNLLSGGHLYKSGLLLVLILILFDIMKPKKKNDPWKILTFVSEEYIKK